MVYSSLFIPFSRKTLQRLEYIMWTIVSKDSSVPPVCLLELWTTHFWEYTLTWYALMSLFEGPHLSSYLWRILITDHYKCKLRQSAWYQWPEHTKCALKWRYWLQGISVQVQVFKDKRGNCTGMNQIKLLTTLSFLSLNIKLENLNRTIEKHIVTALVQKLKKKWK